MCVWGNGAQRGYKKSQHQLVVARGLCLGMLARLAGGGGGKAGEGEGTERTGLLSGTQERGSGFSFLRRELELRAVAGRCTQLLKHQSNAL